MRWGENKKRPSRTWDGRRICVRGATQLRLTSVLSVSLTYRLYNGSNPSLLFWTMDDTYTCTRCKCRPSTMEPFRVAARRAIQH